MEKRGVRLLVIALLQVSIIGIQTISAQADALASIDLMVESGMYKKAIKSLSTTLEREPSNMEVLSKRADLYLNLGKEKEARQDLQTVFQLDDQFGKGQLVYAKLMYLTGDTDSALHYINQGLSFEPEAATVEELYSLEGTVYMSMDLYEDAEASLYKAISSPEVGIQTMRNLASVLVENEKLDEALLVLKETLEIFGNQLETSINTGYVCNQLGLYDEALFYLQEAMELEGENPYALANASLAYLHTGQLDKAFKLVERSLKNDNSNSFAYRVKGECLIAMKEENRACKEFKKAIQMGYTVHHEETEITKLMLKTCSPSSD